MEGASTLPRERRTLTKDTVKSIPPSAPGRKDFVWDDRLFGFGAYRRHDGIVVFVYQYRLPMRSARRITIGRLGDVTPAQAREIAQEHAFQKSRGVDPVDKRRAEAKEADASRSLVMKTYVADYIERRRIEQRPLTLQHERILSRDVAGLMPDVRVDRITTSDIDAFLAELAKRSISARTWGLIYLKVILNDAKRRGTIVRSAADAYKVPDRVERERVLKLFELQRILEACSDMRDTHGLVYECILRTMRRKEEIAAMVWEEIDQATWEWIVPAERTKQSEPVVMTLPPQVVAIIEALHPDKRRRKGFVFSYDGRKSIRVGADQDRKRIDAYIQRRLDLAEEQSGSSFTFEHWVPHDSRTTGATILADDPFDVPTDDIELALGHKVPKSKYNRAQRKAAVNRAIATWNSYLDGIMERPDAWPGGRDLPELGRFETKPLWTRIRATWPQRKADDARVKKARKGKAK
jgi:integrase